MATKPKLIKRKSNPLRDFGEGKICRIITDAPIDNTALNMGTIHIPAATSTPFHTRDYDEVIYMLHGAGPVIMESGERYELEPGDTILIPAGIAHRHANESTSEPLEFIYTFYPTTDTVQASLRALPIMEPAK